MTAPKNKKILITGAAGLLARPVAETLARDNEVWACSLFQDAEQEARTALEAQGVRTFAWDMNRDGLQGLPRDFTHVLHAGVVRTTDSYDDAIEANCISVARLMEHCRTAESFIFVSTMGVYRRQDHGHAYVETDPVGGGHPIVGPYTVAKVAAEGVARSLCRLYELPTTIIRPNVCCGPHSWGGIPIMLLKRAIGGETLAAPLAGSNTCNPIHTDDITRMTPGFWAAASVPATVVNLGGDEVITDQEFMAYIAELTGVRIAFSPNEKSHELQVSNNDRRQMLVGACQVGWREAMKRTVAAHFPELMRG